MKKSLLLLCLLILVGCGQSNSIVADKATGAEAKLFFREDWKQIPAEIPVTQQHVQNSELILTRRGPAKNLIKKSHHDVDPWYVWSGMCDGMWAVTLHKKNALVDLSENGKVRLRTLQSGPNVLKVILGLADGTWLVCTAGFGQTPVWHEFSLDIPKRKWRSLDIEYIVPGEIVKKPDLSRVQFIGWTDLAVGKSSGGCCRVDWIEVYGKEVVK